MTSHDAVPDDVTNPLQRLDDARRDLAERARLARDLRAAHGRLERARSDQQDLRDRLTREQHDVERLEGVSAARVWSTLKGSRETDLERERAEAGVASDAVRRQAALVAGLRSEVEDLDRRARRLEDVDGEYVAALEAVAASGGRVADEHVAGAVIELNRLRELREVEQARTAGRSALQALLAAKGTLDSADAWSGWDTFGGGGFISSSIKHERLDEARQRLGLATEALGRFTRELDDLAVPGVALPEISDMTRGLDIWWDNVLTDLIVRDTIKTALDNVRAAVARVELTLETLDNRREQLTTP